MMNGTDSQIRWTTPWVVLVSALTSASAWLLHTVQPEAVPIYLGAMAWLTLTPDRRPKWHRAHQEIVQNSINPMELIVAPTVTAVESPEPAKPEEPAESTVGKARKPRAKGKKPKTVTLAEVRSLTSSSDRAVVWSQVGPGKFVRQGGSGESESADSEPADSDSADEPQAGNLSQPMVIEAVGKRVATTGDNDNADFE
ncbi:MAG: hypothetical protein ACKO5E_00040 [bacterium]